MSDIHDVLDEPETNATRLLDSRSECERPRQELKDVDDALRALRDATPKGNSLSLAGSVKYLADRSDELDDIGKILSPPPGMSRKYKAAQLVANVAALTEQLRSTNRRLELADEAMRRALAERDELRQSVLTFIEDVKKKAGLQ